MNKIFIFLSQKRDSKEAIIPFSLLREWHFINFKDGIVFSMIKKESFWNRGIIIPSSFIQTLIGKWILGITDSSLLFLFLQMKSFE
jgi:hypothetical protein